MLLALSCASLAVFGAESTEDTPVPQAAEQMAPSTDPVDSAEELDNCQEKDLEETSLTNQPVPNAEVEHEIRVGSEKTSPKETAKPVQRKTIWQWLKGQ